MFQICIHGRGGQGVVTATELLARAAFAAGRHAQAIPSFGSERTGAPVVSYCRISDHVIRTRQPILSPHAVLVQDSTLLLGMDPFAGLAAGGFAVVNTSRPPQQLREWRPSAPPGSALVTVPANAIVMEHLGEPKPSVAMLGALAARTPLLSLEGLAHAVRERFAARVAEANIAAAQAAYDWVSTHSGRDLVRAAPGPGVLSGSETDHG